ncbi:hypothetical protein N0Y54_37215 [Nostoc punctiforme UO1]|uniref:hypothetical protein n=1 Tax=Nostoc punctiforme TaxID=272131 RepID=UPI0030AF75B4
MELPKLWGTPRRPGYQRQPEYLAAGLAVAAPVTHGGNPLGASLSLWEKTVLACL